jgi:hypothetical protein
MPAERDARMPDRWKASMPDRMECRSDVETIVEAAWRAGAFLPVEPWRYLYSIGRHHYFQHRTTRRYRVWVGEVPRSPAPVPAAPLESQAACIPEG